MVIALLGVVFMLLVCVWILTLIADCFILLCWIVVLVGCLFLGFCGVFIADFYVLFGLMWFTLNWCCLVWLLVGFV